MRSALLTLLLSLSALAADKPNLLLITADDLGNQLSCYGDPHIKTPHLDQLAAEGARFKTAWVAQTSCSPSRSAMLTGLFPHTNGQLGLTGQYSGRQGFALHEGIVQHSLPNQLKKAGYRTGLVGKLHVSPEKGFAFDIRRKPNMRDIRAIADQSAEFIDSGETPFFLMVNYSDPHALRNAPSGKGWHFPATFKGHPKNPIPTDRVPGWNFQAIDTPLTRKRVSNFYNTVMRLDDGIGMLMAELEKRELAENTLVIFIGDHGPPFNRAKTTCYEAGLQVPLLVRWPSEIKPKQVRSEMAMAVDLVPTFLEAAKLKPSGKLQGQSLLPPLRSEAKEWRTEIFAEFQFHGSKGFFPRLAVRDQRFKLIHNPLAGKAKPPVGIDGDPTARIVQDTKYDNTPARRAYQLFTNPPEWELYDLDQDPHERNNLANKPEHSGDQKRLQAALADWQKSTDDPLLKPDWIQQMQSR